MDAIRALKKTKGGREMNATEAKGYRRACDEVLMLLDEHLRHIEEMVGDCQAHGDASGEIEWDGAKHEAQSLHDAVNALKKTKGGGA